MPKNNKIPQIATNNKILQANLLKMHQNYDQWNKVKKRLYGYTRRSLQAGSIYWARIGLNIGTEINGKGNESARPVLVIAIFKDSSFWGVPLSSKNRPSYLEFFDSNGTKQYACIEKMRHLDSKRIKNQRLATVDNKTLVLIRNELKKILS